jgi:glutamate:GABA antiporter
MNLEKSLSRRDVFFFLVCTLVGLDTLGSVAARGGEGFLWLVVLALFFFVPYALLVAELGSTFPAEGGPYVWAKLAFGRRTAAIVAVFYWVSNPIWLGGALTITAITTWNTFFFELGPFAKYVFGLALVWASILGAILSFRVGKWITIVGAWARVLLLGFFTLSVALYALVHGVHGMRFPDLAPSYDGFFAVVPLLFFNFVGFELPSAAGDEMVDPRRDVPFAVMRAAVAAVLCYGIPILSILVVLPAERITGLKGFIDAMQTVFGVYGTAGTTLGRIAAMGFILALVTSGTSWIMGADRSQAVACLDGAGPRALGAFANRWGTPVPLNIASGIIATIVMLGAFAVAGASSERFFVASLNLGISTTTISYLGIFPALYLLRRRERAATRPYRVPGGDAGAIVVSALTLGWALLATICLVWPGFGRADPDAALPSGFDRLGFEATQVLPLLVFLAVGLSFPRFGRPAAAQRLRALVAAAS